MAEQEELETTIKRRKWKWIREYAKEARRLTGTNHKSRTTEDKHQLERSQEEKPESCCSEAICTIRSEED